MSKNLHVRQIEILRFIISFLEEFGYPPSIREIAKGVNLSSTSTVHQHLNKLEYFGLIKRNPTLPRAITIFYDECEKILK